MDFLLAEKDANVDTRRSRCAAGSPGSTRECQASDSARRSSRRATRSGAQVLDDIAWPAEGEAGDELRRRVLQSLPRHDGVGLLLERDGLEGPRYMGNVAVAEWNGCPPAGARRSSASARCHDGRAGPPKRMKRLGVGFIGSGFNARFHMQGVARACATPTCAASGARTRRTPRAAAALRARPRRRRRASRTRRSPTWSPIRPSMRSGSPDRTRRASRTSRRSSHAIESGTRHARRASPARSRSRGTSPRRSRCVELVKRVGLTHGYLENQVFAPQVETGRALLWARGAATTGRPYLARAAEEHSGPHMPWFWRGAAAGRRRAQRHDVPLGARRAAPAHEAGRAAVDA